MKNVYGQTRKHSLIHLDLQKPQCHSWGLWKRGLEMAVWLFYRGEACQLELFQFLCLCVRISHKQSLMDLRGVSVDFSPSKDYADLHSARSIKAGQCPSFSPRHSALSSCGSSRPNVFTATTWESLVRAEFERDRWVCLGLRDLVTEADKCKLIL